MNNEFFIISKIMFFRLGSELTINARKWQFKCNDLQKLIDEESSGREEAILKLNVSEKKVVQLCNEVDNLKRQSEEADRRRSFHEQELIETQETLEETKRSNESLSSLKVKLQTDLELLNVSIILCRIKL